MPYWQQIASAIFPPASPSQLDGLAPRRVWPVAALVALAAFIICMAFADRRGLWLDEFITLSTSRLGLAELTSNRLDAGHSPVYFVYAAIGARLGESNYALRSTSALMAAINVLMLTGLALALGLRRILPALWCVALALPYWISIGTEYRYMMFLTAAVSGMLWIAASYAENFDSRRGIALALAVAAVAWIHASAHVIIFLAGVFIFIRAREKPRPLVRSLVCAWPVILGWASSIPFLIRIAGHQSITQADAPRLLGVVFNLLQSVLGSDPRDAQISRARIAIYIMAALYLVISIVASRRILLNSGRKPAWQLLAVLLTGMPVCFILFCLLFKNHQGPVRYLAAYAIPCAFCLAIYTGSLWRHRPSRPLAIAGILFLSLQGLVVGLSHGEMLRETINWVLAQRRPQDAFVCSIVRLPKKMMQDGGVQDTSFVVGFPLRNTDEKKVAAEIKRRTAASPRGFGLLYHTDLPLRKVLDDLNKERFIARYQRKKVSSSVTLIVWTRSDADADWLKHIKWPKDRLFD